jgi:hypothetical protein
MKQHIFLHIPKTAGSSVRTLIQQNYPPDATIGFSGDPEPLAWYRARTTAFKHRYSLLHGHVPYGIHEGLNDYLYFTFLRDPVARHFSDYDFLRRYASHPMHAEISGGRITPGDWATIFDRHPVYRNRITRFVSGDGDGRIPDRLSLETAKLHLSREFAPVGLAERFDESVLVLAKRLGWRSIFYLTKNVTAKQSQLTPAIRKAAGQGLELDLELYAFAQRLFDEAPELRDPRFPDALREFRDVRTWLESYVANNPHDMFLVGGELPSLSDIVERHHRTPALIRYFDWPSRRAA